MQSNAYRQAEATYEACKVLIDAGGHSGADEAKLYAQLGEAFYWGYRFDSAIEAFNRALELDQTLFETRIQRGWAHLRTNESSRASQDFHDAFEAHPESGRAAFAIGYMYGTQGDHEKELIAYKQAVQLSPKYHLARGALTDIYRFQTREIKKALSELDTLVAFGEEELNTVQFTAGGRVFESQDYHARVLFDRSRVLIEDQQYDRAIKDAEWLITRYPDHFAPLALKADALTLDGWFVEASIAAEAAHSLCIIKTPFFECDYSGLMLIRALNMLKKYKQAAEVGKQLLQDKREGEFMPQAIYLAGIALKHLGEIPDARKYMVMAMQSDPYLAYDAIAKLKYNDFYNGELENQIDQKVLNGLDACLLDEECLK